MKYIRALYSPFIIVPVILLASVGFVFVVQQKNTTVKGQTVSNLILDKSIATLQTAIATQPSVIKNYIDLSNAYLQKVRETGDSTYYTKIDALMDTATKIDPTNADVPATRSAVAMGRHNFQLGQHFAEQALALNNHREAYYGLLGDADIELGQYSGAVDAFQKMVDIRPDFSSYSRIAYIRELYGDITGAKDALHVAIASGSSFPENIAWAYVELGKLDMRTNLDQAKIDFGHALDVLPTYTQAMEGLGKVAYAQGDNQSALADFTNALHGLPLAQYPTDLADVYASEGDTVHSAQNIALAEVAYTTSASSGVDTDLEESLFLSDHNTQLDTALADALRAHAVRPNEYASDYLAWAYYKNGNYVEAAKYRTESLRLGDFDPLILFHQGMIAYKNNDMVLAKKYLDEAYALSPNFSIEYSGVLKDMVAKLK